MIPLSWGEIERLQLGELRGAPVDGIVHRVHDDSRDVRPGDLFVALNTGIRFVEDALARGGSTLVPGDQEAALAALARLVRDRSDAMVVAVVGSTGKTSTKDALSALCAHVVPTIGAEASKNNELGLPLTVLRLEPQTRILVTEMGMRGLGQIAELCAIARPTAAVVTTIGPEHLELVGSVEHVARANAEAIAALPGGGLAVIPADAPELEPYLGREDLDVRRFDRRSVRRLDERPGSDPRGQTPVSSRWGFQVDTPDGPAPLELDLPFDQRHMAENVLAALTAYVGLGLPLDRVQEGASRIRLSRWRGEVRALKGGGLVVNDAYNANPTSMRAALLDLTERAGGRRRVAILGEMAELGDAADGYHREIGRLLDELGVEVVIGVGAPARAYLGPGVPVAREIAGAEAFDTVSDLLEAGDAILVKASRAVGLEGIPAQIEKLSEAW